MTASPSTSPKVELRDLDPDALDSDLVAAAKEAAEEAAREEGLAALTCAAGVRAAPAMPVVSASPEKPNCGVMGS